MTPPPDIAAVGWVPGVVPGLAGGLTFIIIWHLAAATGLVGLPTPGEALAVLAALVVKGDPLYGWTLQQFTWASLQIVLKGWAASTAVAVPLGLAMGFSPRLERVAGGFLELMRPLPPVAWIPLAYLIFAAFPGPTAWVQTFVVFVGAFFPTLVTTTEAVKGVDPLYIEAARTFGASPRQVLSKVVIPAVLPSVITGTRIGLGVGWMCIVAAEFVGGRKGIGFYIWSVYNVGGRAPEIVAGMVAIGVVGYLANRGLLWVEKRLSPWRW